MENFGAGPAGLAATFVSQPDFATIKLARFSVLSAFITTRANGPAKFTSSNVTLNCGDVPAFSPVSASELKPANSSLCAASNNPNFSTRTSPATVTTGG